MSETWLPVVGYEGLYSISDKGRVRSERRTIALQTGGTRIQQERILKPTIARGYYHVILCESGRKETCRIHVLVLRAFRGEKPPRHEGLHENDIKLDNRLSNLRWGTRSDNCYDRVRNGLDHNAKRVVCDKGHQFTIRADGGRRCATCKQEYDRERYLRLGPRRLRAA